jgi:uncharacterized protein with LGFP repeats
VLLRHYDQSGHYVTGAIGDEYRRRGWQASPLGWPTSNETHGASDTIYQTFEHGRLAWAPDGTIALNETGEVI